MLHLSSVTFCPVRGILPLTRRTFLPNFTKIRPNNKIRGTTTTRRTRRIKQQMLDSCVLCSSLHTVYILHWKRTRTGSQSSRITDKIENWRQKTTKTRKLSYRKDDRAMRPALEIFRSPWLYPRLYFSGNFTIGFSSDWCYEYAYKIWSSQLYPFLSQGYAHVPFFIKFFLWTFVRTDPVNLPTKFEVRSFTRSRGNWSTQKI